MAWNVTWDETDPAAGDDANLAHVDIQNVKKSIRERIAVDHDAATGDDTDTWTHKTFTGKIGKGTAAARPAASSTYEDKMYYSTDTGEFAVCDGSNWISLSNSEYNTGTVSVTEDSTTVEGSGTDFTQVSAGDVFWIEGGSRYYEISSITDGTELELTEVYEGTTAAGASYHVGRVNMEQFLPRVGGSWFNGTLGTNLNANSKKITGLAAAASNGDALRYEHTTADPIDHPDSSVSLVKLASDVPVVGWAIGKYTGNGSEKEVDCGLDLSSGDFIILVYSTYEGSGKRLVIKTSEDAATAALAVSEDYDTDLITAVGETGFTIGDNDDVNRNGESYIYLVLKFIQ